MNTDTYIMILSAYTYFIGAIVTSLLTYVTRPVKGSDIRAQPMAFRIVRALIVVAWPVMLPFGLLIGKATRNR